MHQDIERLNKNHSKHKTHNWEVSHTGLINDVGFESFQCNRTGYPYIKNKLTL